MVPESPNNVLCHATLSGYYIRSVTTKREPEVLMQRQNQSHGNLTAMSINLLPRFGVRAIAPP